MNLLQHLQGSSFPIKKEAFWENKLEIILLMFLKSFPERKLKINSALRTVMPISHLLLRLFLSKWEWLCFCFIWCFVCTTSSHFPYRTAQIFFLPRMSLQCFWILRQKFSLTGFQRCTTLSTSFSNWHELKDTTCRWNNENSPCHAESNHQRWPLLGAAQAH